MDHDTALRAAPRHFLDSASCDRKSRTLLRNGRKPCKSGCKTYAFALRCKGQAPQAKNPILVLLPMLSRQLRAHSTHLCFVTGGHAVGHLEQLALRLLIQPPLLQQGVQPLQAARDVLPPCAAQPRQGCLESGPHLLQVSLWNRLVHHLRAADLASFAPVAGRCGLARAIKALPPAVGAWHAPHATRLWIPGRIPHNWPH